MKINLLSIDDPRPDRRNIANFLTDNSVGINDSLAKELTNNLIEGDIVEIEIPDSNTASALRNLRKLNIDYEIIE